MRAMLLLLVACAQPVDDRYLDYAVGAVERAMEHVDFPLEGDVIPISVTGHMGELNAYFFFYENRIDISDTIDGLSNLPCVVAHEVGHALGLNHVSDRQHVMYGGGNCMVDVGRAARQLKEACLERGFPCRKIQLEVIHGHD